MSDTTESDYYTFMRFDPDNARSVLSHYLQFFTDGPVLELASGPGVFLTLLRENGVHARGVDLDPGMVEESRAAGHDVVLDDAIAHLRATPDASLRGLFAAHFLEHLPAPDVQELYREAARVLSPGGVFVAVVPNAACLSVLGYDFWRDPTHVRFYDPVVLQFFAGKAGLSVLASGGNPRNHPGPPPTLSPPELPELGTLAPDVIGIVQHAHSIASVQDEADVPRSKGLRRSAEATHRLVVEASRDSATAQAAVWGEFGHVVSELDARLQQVNHNLSELRMAYSRLLEQLYPPNEVFVAAVKSEPATNDVINRAMSDVTSIEGTV